MKYYDEELSPEENIRQLTFYRFKGMERVRSILELRKAVWPDFIEHLNTFGVEGHSPDMRRWYNGYLHERGNALLHIQKTFYAARRLIRRIDRAIHKGLEQLPRH